jgi:hypothetical protein
LFPHLHDDSPIVLSKPNNTLIQTETELNTKETLPLLSPTDMEVTENFSEAREEFLEEIKVLDSSKSSATDRPKKPIQLHTLVDEPEVEEQEEVFYVPSFTQTAPSTATGTKSTNIVNFQVESQDDLPVEEGKWEDTPNVPSSFPQLESLDSVIPEESDELLEM